MESKLFKKLFSMILVIAMVLSMCPTFVFAESTTVDKTDPDYCPHCNKIVEWTSADAANSKAWTTGHYRISGDKSITAAMTVAVDEDVVIDLNGKTITVTRKASTTRRAFVVDAGATLSIVDKTAKTAEDGTYTSGKITGGLVYTNVSTAGSEAYGGNILNYGTVNLYSGAITGGQAQAASKYAAKNFGGNIANLAGSTFNMYGGMLKEGVARRDQLLSTSVTSGGGNLYGLSATLNIEGGIITDGLNRTYYSSSSTTSGERRVYAAGGNIAVQGGTLTISGDAVITDGTVGGKAADGTYLVYGQCTGGAEDGGAHGFGGNIYASGATILIKGNAQIKNGRVELRARCTFATGAVTADSLLTAKGGNIYVTKSQLTVQDNAKIYDGWVGGLSQKISNMGTADEKIAIGTMDCYGGNVFLEDTTTVANFNSVEISGGYASYRGGNLSINNAKANLNGTTVIKNGGVGTEKNAADGNNIYVAGSSSMLSVYDDVKVFGGVTEGECEIYMLTGGKATFYGGQVDGEVFVSGTDANKAAALKVFGGTFTRISRAETYIAENQVVIYNGAVGFGVGAEIKRAECTCVLNEGGFDKVWHVGKECTAETCAYVKAVADAAALGHTVVPATQQHPWGEMQVLTAPTCTVAGSGKHTCTVCGEEETVVLEPTGEHIFLSYASDENATCKVDGTETAKCETCNATDTRTVVDSHLSVPHTYGPMEGGKQTCTVCGHENACDHDYKSVVTDPTCTEQGYTTHTCTKCNDTFVDTYVDSVDHVYTKYESNNNATCTADGTKTAVCDTCGVATDTVTDAGSMLDHAYGQWENGVKTCKDCGETLVCTHPETELKNKKEATCQAPGYTGDLTCKECGTITEAGSETDQLTHVYDPETGICANGCNALAEAKVVTNGNVTYYTKAIDALVAANGTGAEVCILKTTTVTMKDTFGTEAKALKNVTISTAEGVTLKDNSGYTSGAWYVANITFAANSKFELNGYMHCVDGSVNNIYGNVKAYAIGINDDSTLNLYGDQGAFLRSTCNFFITTNGKNGAKFNIYGNGGTEPVFVANEGKAEYSIANYSGYIYIENAVISVGSIALRSDLNKESSFKPGITAVDSTIIVRNTHGSASVAASYSLNISEKSAGITLINSTLQMPGTTAIADDAVITLSAGSRFITTTADLQNIRVVAAEGVNGCIKYVDGAYTIVDHTAPNASCTEDGKCTNCGAVINVASGHTLAKTEAEPSSCTKAGHAAYWYCSVCEKYFADADATKVIEDLTSWLAEGGEGYDAIDDHDHQEIVKPENLVSAATCQAAAVYNKSCSVCGEKSEETFSYGEVDKNNHVEVKTVDAKAATCLEAGWATYEYCTKCDYTTKVEQPMLEHNYTYKDNGDKTHTVTCDKGCNHSEVLPCADENGDKLCDLCEQKLIDPKFTVDGVEVETLDEALALAVSGSVIKLLDNVVLTERLTLDKELRIDLEGYSITGAFEDAFGMIYVKKGAVITFVDGLIENTADVAIGNYGYVIVGTDATVKGYGAGLYNFYYQADYYGGSRISGEVNAIWNSGELVISEDAVVEYLDNSGYATVYGTVNEIYAQDGSDAPDVYNGGMLIISDVAKVTTLSVPEDYKLVEVEENVYKVEACNYVAEVNGEKFETLAEALAADGEVKLIADIDATASGVIVAAGEIIDLNGYKLTADIIGVTIKMNGGTFATSEYLMVGTTEGKYTSTDAIFTIAPNATMDMTIISGTITLNETLWYTLKGQTMTIEKDATFVIPAGKTLYVNGSKVVVNGTAANFGTLILANGAHLVGDVAGTFQMAGGTFETSKYVMIGATQGKYLSTDAVFTVAPNATMDMTFISGTVTLNETLWYTLEDQTLTVNEDAKFVIPAGKTLYINESVVVVNGEIEVEGNVQLTANATVAYADGTLADKFVTNAGDTVIYENGAYKVHNHSYATKVTAPTCTEKGFTTYTCTCGDEYVAGYVDETGHTYTSEYHAATNTENAYTVYTCHCGDTYTVIHEGTVLHFAVNVQTGESYAELQAALNAAAKGDTVKLLKDVEAADVYVGAGKTLDLNGFELTVTSSFSASFTTTHVIDSSNGEGLLVVAGADVALNESNKQLPVWTAAGVKFVEIVYKQIIQAVPGDADAKKFRFYFNVADESILPTLLKEDCITIRVKVNYTTASGLNAYQYFELTDSLIEQYVNKWPNKTFDLTLKGVTGLSGLSFTAEIVSTAPSGLSVVKSSSTCPV